MYVGSRLTSPVAWIVRRCLGGGSGVGVVASPASPGEAPPAAFVLPGVITVGEPPAAAGAAPLAGPGSPSRVPAHAIAPAATRARAARMAETGNRVRRAWRVALTAPRRLPSPAV